MEKNERESREHDLHLAMRKHDLMRQQIAELQSEAKDTMETIQDLYLHMIDAVPAGDRQQISEEYYEADVLVRRKTVATGMGVTLHGFRKMLKRLCPRCRREFPITELTDRLSVPTDEGCKTTVYLSERYCKSCALVEGEEELRRELEERRLKVINRNYRSEWITGLSATWEESCKCGDRAVAVHCVREKCQGQSEETYSQNYLCKKHVGALIALTDIEVDDRDVSLEELKIWRSAAPDVLFENSD